MSDLNTLALVGMEPKNSFLVQALKKEKYGT